MTTLVIQDCPNLVRIWPINTFVLAKIVHATSVDANFVQETFVQKTFFQETFV